MKFIALLIAAFTPLPLLAQTQQTDNTVICHIPGQTKESKRPAVLVPGYGDSHMTVSTKSPEAQAFFDQGLALVHSFWFYEADRSFARAADLDPTLAMAHWGIAMCDVNEARRNTALGKARELAAGASDREKLYISAVEARYSGEKSAVQNNGFLGATEDYRKALRRIVSLYPDDLDAKLFLALASLSGYEKDGTPRAGTIEGIALLQVVISKDPRNLAAHHYMIHATESGKRAVDGVLSADMYGSLAPKVGHAVHMPGHTYVHVDRWQDAANAFEASAEVDRRYIRENGEKTDNAAGPYGHNVHFLVTVYVYQGRYRDAMRLSEELLDAAKQPGEEKSRAGLEGRLARLRTLVRFEKWDQILEGESLPVEANYDVFKAWRYYAQGLALLGTGKLDGAKEKLNQLEREIAWMKDYLAGHGSLPQIGRQRQQLKALAVAPIEMKARIAAREGRSDEAVTLLRKAIEEEVNVGYAEPPLYPQPTEEVAGKVAAELKLWNESLEFFRAALERDPGSGRAYLGLSQALQNLGRTDEARAISEKFAKAWAIADTDLPELNRSQVKGTR